MKTLFAKYWPLLATFLLGAALVFILKPSNDDSGAIKAAQANAAAAGKLADAAKADAAYWHGKFVADTTGDDGRKRQLAASAKKAADLRAITHPTIKKPNAFNNPKSSPAMRDSALVAADTILNGLAQ